jgi:hypothetical protein
MAPVVRCCTAQITLPDYHPPTPNPPNPHPCHPPPHPPSLPELKVKYYELMIQYHMHSNNYLEVCRAYRWAWRLG